MRILHLLSQTELTGAEVYAQNLIESQHHQGLSVFVISDHLHVPLPVEPLLMRISTNSFWRRMLNILKLRRFLKKNEIQVIHCHSRGAARHAYWARWRLPVAQVTTLHGRQHFSWSKRFFNIYGELMIAICENAKLAQMHSFKTPESLIRVVRNPLSLKSFGGSKSLTGPRLALLGRSSGPKRRRIESIGLACFETWLQKIPQLRIFVIAPKPERFSKNFQAHVARLNAAFPGQIQFQGEKPELRAELAQFDLAICSGRIAMECLLEGTAVFACGEYSAPGLVRDENWPAALASNFGDIGIDAMESDINMDEVKIHVLAGLQRPPRSMKTAAAAEFDESLIQRKLVDIYKAAIFKRHYPQWIPALMYHKIPLKESDSKHRIFVTKENFEKHLQFFRRKHFTTLTFRDLLEYWDLKRDYTDFPDKPLLLTFDDGYKDNLAHLQPLLREYNMKATIFLLADHSLTLNTWDVESGEAPEALLTLEEKKQLDPQAFEIGSHGFHHLHLTKLTRQEAFKEMKDSKLQLEKDLQTQIVAFAYPFGSTEPALADLCFEAGYRFAVNTDQGGLVLADHPHSIYRVNIFPEDKNWALRRKTSSWYRRHKRAR